MSKENRAAAAAALTQAVFIEVILIVYLVAMWGCQQGSTKVAVNPDEVVIEGSGYQGGLCEGELCVGAHSYGLEDDGYYVFTVATEEEPGKVAVSHYEIEVEFEDYERGIHSMQYGLMKLADL